jgi:hypothetical protein
MEFMEYIALLFTNRCSFHLKKIIGKCDSCARVYILRQWKWKVFGLLGPSLTCFYIFIHSLDQPLIVRSHSKVHRSWGNPKEIPTWASCVSNYRYFHWDNKHGVQRQVRTPTREIIGNWYIISNIFASDTK